MAENYEVRISFSLSKVEDGKISEINSLDNLYSGMDYADVVIVQQVVREMANSLWDLGLERVKMMGMGDKLKILDGFNTKKDVGKAAAAKK